MDDKKIYPVDYDDNELKEEIIKKCRSLNSVERSTADIQVQAPSVQHGLIELQRRQTSKLSQQVEKMTKTIERFEASSSNLARIMIILAFAMLILTMATFVFNVLQFIYSNEEIINALRFSP